MASEREWFLAKMTWPEAKEALAKADCVLIPVGSTEQHGHHLAVGNDAYATVEVARRVAEKAHPRLRLVVTPPIHYGQSEHHMAFAGTITLSVETFMDVVYDVCASLVRHGVRRIAVFNGHGGNTAPLSLVLQFRVKREFGVEVMLINWWTYFADIAQPTHADRAETSLSMYLLPDFVREDRIRNPTVKTTAVDLKELGWDAQVSPLLLNMGERTDTGALPPDPTQASRELGEKAVEKAVERITHVLQKLCTPTRKKEEA